MTNEPDNGADILAEAPSGNRRLRVIIVSALVIAILIAGVWYYRYSTYGRFMQSTDNAYVAADTVVVSSKVPGFVDEVLVSDNQQVARGDMLIRLDVRDFSAQTSQAEAQIRSALAGADVVRSQIVEQDAVIRQAQAQVSAARAALALANEQVSRYRPLAASGAEPREKLDQFEARARQAAADMAAAEAAVSGANSRRSTLRAQIDQARAQADAARAQRDAAQVNVDSSNLQASIAARVGDLSVRVGQFIQPGQRLMSLVPTDRVYVTANFKETQVGLVRAGQPVQLEVDALPDVEIAGRVESIAPGTGAEFSILPPENATGNFTKIVQRIPVRISIDATPELRRLLVPGMSVVATIDTRSARDELEALNGD